MKYSKYSVVIIGSGISGLYLALKLASQKHLKDGILIVTKSDMRTSSSELAQGGIVAVLPEINKNDSISSHVSDTIKAGCGLNDFNTVKYISQNSSCVIQDLINLGIEFDKNPDGKLNFALEAAHSVPRILHVKDATGFAIENALCQKVCQTPEIDIYENTSAIELLVDKNNCTKGVIVYNRETDSYEAVYSAAVVLATGGIGQVYAHTTNPKIATGDGIALAFRAGAVVENMEFVQFHPSALAVSNKVNMPLVSEAVRGAGAKLCDLRGNYFAKDFDERGELAPRDVVARAIYTTMLNNNDDSVYLDISQMGIEFFRKRFPNIAKSCEDNGVDVSDGLIPVAPAAHYFMGGIKTNVCAETSITNLYALGECACSGFHGANRLASNSLLECAAGGYELAGLLCEKNLDAPKNFDKSIKSILEKYEQDVESVCELEDVDIEDIKNNIRDVMWECAGIIRSREKLLYAKSKLEEFTKLLGLENCAHTSDCYEAKNMILVSSLIVESALKRENSIGAHYRQDCPQVSSQPGADFCIKCTNGIGTKNGEIFVE